MADKEESGIYGRPRESLLELPFKYRWELTRRHPYYLLQWKAALSYRLGTLTPEDPEFLQAYWAFLLLGHIGVTGEPVDPATSVEDLEADVQGDAGFLCGPVEPMTIRGILVGLLRVLPSAELQVAGALFNVAGETPDEIAGVELEPEDQRQQAIDELARMPSTAYDSHFDAPLFYIRLAASKKSINESMSRHVDVWKAKRRIPETRLQTNKFDGYLAVWDQREGWTGSGYDHARCRTLDQIAKDLKVGRNTIASRYRKAFKLITGHEYSTKAWVQLLLPLHYGDHHDELAAAHRRRYQSLAASRQPTTVSQSVVETSAGGEASSSGIMETLTAIGDETALTEFMIDVKDLIEGGRTNAEIAQELEVPEDFITALRARLSDDYLAKG